jgi:hypothetical protein
VTRFAYAHTLPTHAADSRLALRNTVECLEFVSCVKADNAEMKEKLAKFRKIVENSAFWDNVRDLASLMQPMLVYLRHFDGPDPKMNEVVPMTESLIQTIDIFLASSSSAESSGDTFRGQVPCQFLT